MIPWQAVALALWLTLQLGACIGYLIALNGQKPRRKFQTPPKLRGKSWISPRFEVVDEAA